MEGRAVGFLAPSLGVLDLSDQVIVCEAGPSAASPPSQEDQDIQIIEHNPSKNHRLVTFNRFAPNGQANAGFRLSFDDYGSFDVLSSPVAQEKACAIRIMPQAQRKPKQLDRIRKALFWRRPVLPFTAASIAARFTLSIRRCVVCLRRVAGRLQLRHARAHFRPSTREHSAPPQRRRATEPGVKALLRACYKSPLPVPRRQRKTEVSQKAPRQPPKDQVPRVKFRNTNPYLSKTRIKCLKQDQGKASEKLRDKNVAEEKLSPYYLYRCTWCSLCGERQSLSTMWPHSAFHEPDAAYRCSLCPDYVTGYRLTILSHTAKPHPASCDGRDHPLKCGQMDEVVWSSEAAEGAMRRCYAQWGRRRAAKPPTFAQRARQTLRELAEESIATKATSHNSTSSFS